MGSLDPGEKAQPHEEYLDQAQFRVARHDVGPPGGVAYVDYIYNPAAKIHNGVCEPTVKVIGFSVAVPGATDPVIVAVSDLTMCTGAKWMSESSTGPVDSEARAASS